MTAAGSAVSPVRQRSRFAASGFEKTDNAIGKVVIPNHKYQLRFAR